MKTIIERMSEIEELAKELKELIGVDARDVHVTRL